MNPLEKLQKITTFVFDFDGVLTNGSLILTEGGEERRTMNIYDGYAIRHAAIEGFKIFIISGSTIPGARTRLSKLGAVESFFGIPDKHEVLMGIFKKHELSSEEVLYMGDDVPDFEAMQACGVRACPPNAMPEIFSNVDLITLAKGGEGAVREIIEKTLRIQDKWNSISIHQA